MTTITCHANTWRSRFDKEESITMDWAVDARLPQGTFRLEDLWHDEELGEVVVGGEGWQGAQWRGILPAHDNWAFVLRPVE